MKKDRTCKYCNKIFKDCEGKVFSNHVKWCEKNPKSIDNKKKSGALSKDPEKIEKRLVTKYGKIKDFTVTCAKCGKQFIVSEREKLFPRKEKYFCCKQCSRTFRLHSNVPKSYHLTCIVCGKKFISHYSCEKFCSEDCHQVYLVDNTEIFSKEHSQILSKYNSIDRCYHMICEQCGKKFDSTSYKRFCCKDCMKKHLSETVKSYRKKKREERFKSTEIESKEKVRLTIYKSECNFTFKLKDYSDEFDFNLIKQFGWYKAKNHGNNLNGVSRDHMFSVMEGFRQGIDPSIISHPANCKLVRHNDNISKGDKCSITLEELLERIKQWNKKYSK